MARMDDQIPYRVTLAPAGKALIFILGIILTGAALLMAVATGGPLLWLGFAILLALLTAATR